MGKESDMTRSEHLQWCKDRALKYVESGDLNEAVTSMLSDLSKHPETSAASGGILAQLGMFELMINPTRQSITRYIEGFN
jgi:hypothetical protein